MQNEIKRKRTIEKYSYQMFSAVENNDIQTVGVLLEKGADANYKDFSGKTPLFTALENNNKSIISLLLDNDANINYETKDSWTPLIFAIDRNNAKLAELLIKNGADINYETKNAWTALMYAIDGRKANLVELLLQNDADINYETKDGWTPLIYVIERNYANLVELLIKNGANVNYVTKDGTTPLEYALETRKLKIASLLLKYTNGNKNSLSKNSVSYQTNTEPTSLQTQGAFNTALVSLSKIIAKYGNELFLTKNKRKLIGLISDLFPQSNEFYQKFKEAFSSDFAELLFLANEKSEDEKIAVLKMASDEIMRNTGLQNADAIVISKLVALSLDWDLEMWGIK